MIVGYERPITSGTLRPSREACESCHYPPTSTTTASPSRCTTAPTRRAASRAPSSCCTPAWTRAAKATPRASTGTSRTRSSFVSPDPQRREIPWVAGEEARRHARSPTSTRTPSSPCRRSTKLETRRMACYDCHNSVGHPFGNPADDGRRGDPHRQDRPLRCPTAKARAVGLIDAAGELTASEGARGEGRQADRRRLRQGRPRAEHKQTEQKFNKAMREILLAASFQGRREVLLEVVPEPHGARRHARLLPLPRRQALQRQGRGDPPAVHAVPRPAGGRRREAARARVAVAGRRPARSSRRATSAQLHAHHSDDVDDSARSATARSSTASRAATSAPTRPATAAPGRSSTSTCRPDRGRHAATRSTRPAASAPTEKAAPARRRASANPRPRGPRRRASGADRLLATPKRRTRSRGAVPPLTPAPRSWRALPCNVR